MRPFDAFLTCRVLVVLLTLFVPLDRAAQSPSAAPQIHVATHLVQIGIIVRDKNGPVANLTKDDFSVLDRGKAQKVSVFTVESTETTTQPAEPLPENTFSDVPQYGASKPRSVTIVLLDNLNTLSGSTPLPYETTPHWLEDHALANAKHHLIQFLEQMDANDRIAIYSLTGTLRVVCDFTCNRAQLLAVVAKYDPTSKTQRDAAETGQYNFPDQPPDSPRAFNDAVSADAQRFAAVSNQARAQTTMEALVAIAAHVADIPGRKNLLWLTANLPFSGQAIARILGRANIAAYPVDARGLLPRTSATSMDDLKPGDGTVRGALGIADASSESDQPVGIDTMEEMAEETGGRAFVNTNNLTEAIQKTVEDSAVTYTVGFYLGAAELDGKFHELKVKVKRSGLDLRYPKGYLAQRDVPATDEEQHNGLVVAIRSPLESSSIPLQVSLMRVEKPLAHSLSVSGLIDVHNLRIDDTPGAHKGVVEVATIEQDETGKILRQSSSRIVLHFTEAQYADVLKSGFPFHQFVQPQAGATTLRFIVEDSATAQIGSVIVPLSRIH